MYHSNLFIAFLMGYTAEAVSHSANNLLCSRFHKGTLPHNPVGCALIKKSSWQGWCLL
ncbi:hypothetical protein C0J52_09295 [Blattella germanica]|nr:hypothetical protein C0J52_09295 [Blattella germanica]